MRARPTRSVNHRNGSSPPSINATFDVEVDGFNVSLDATRSSARPGDINVYAWDIGDGGQAFGPQVTYQFGSEGTFQIRLTVTDSLGNQDTTRKTVEVPQNEESSPPILAILALAAGAYLVIS